MKKGETVDESDIYDGVKRCYDHFQKGFAEIDKKKFMKNDCQSMRATWENYYFSEFSDLDLLLSRYVGIGGLHYDAFLPLSIYHHNLHRLIEVLDAELGSKSLESTRIPERMSDLFEMCTRLSRLFEDILENKRKGV